MSNANTHEPTTREQRAEAEKSLRMLPGVGLDGDFGKRLIADVERLEQRIRDVYFQMCAPSGGKEGLLSWAASMNAKPVLDLPLREAVGTMITDLGVLRIKRDRLEREREALVEALQPGQKENAELVFQVRVSGLPAMPQSPREVAFALAAMWERTTRANRNDPLVNVRVEEPAILARVQDGETEGDAKCTGVSRPGGREHCHGCRIGETEGDGGR